jgi:protoporphyrinogen oxidase
MNTLQTKYLIIGAGLSGLSAAYYLREDYLLFEANDYAGGTANTLQHKGYKLDNSVHVLYFRDKTILDWIRQTLQIELLEKTRKCSVWVKNTYIKFPLQYNLSDLPFTSKVDSVKSIFAALLISKWKRFRNFEEYSLNTFGNYLTDIFIRPYNEKLFGVAISQMNTDWLGDYVPAYSKITMLLSVSGLVRNNYGRNSNYYYPSEGGISTLAKGISFQLNISPVYSRCLQNILLDKKTAIFTDGTEVNYKYLINTIPVNYFLKKIKSLPSNISLESESLKKNSTTLLHILGKGNLEAKYDWIYVPEQEIPFYRITIPGNINPKNCPANHFALTLEYGGDVCDDEKVLNLSLNALKKMGILNDKLSDIEYCWTLINCSYIIYDENRETILKKIFSFLKDKQVFSIGRYGSWEYSNMEDAIIHGKRVAEKLLNN